MMLGTVQPQPRLIPPGAYLPQAPRTACEVNDVHSQLNRTTVREVVQVESVRALQEAVRGAAARGLSISIAGGRHSMGGQQFGAGTVLLDMTALNRVIELDPERGLVTVEAGIDWPRLINHLLWAGAGQEHQWGIVQKQTGADRLTVGGALSSNIHGRGLRLRPMIGDVESFDLVDHSGALVTCSRTSNAELFALAIGGYGLFGAIARVTLRLAPRRKIERRVVLACADNLPELFDRRIRDGYEFGDWQFATDAGSPGFMQAGVFSCYRPVTDDYPMPDDQRSLSARDWQRLLRLAHTDKPRAFAEYARYYMSTDGQLYWSDTHQLASYVDGYHETLDRELGATVKGQRDDLGALRPAARSSGVHGGDPRRRAAPEHERHLRHHQADRARRRERPGLGAPALGVCRDQPSRRSHRGRAEQGADGFQESDRDCRVVRRHLLLDVSPLGHARPGRAMSSADAGVSCAQAGVRPV